MMGVAAGGTDVSFAHNAQSPQQSFDVATQLSGVLCIVQVVHNGIRLTREAPDYRLISKRVINLILRHA